MNSHLNNITAATIPQPPSLNPSIKYGKKSNIRMKDEKEKKKKKKDGKRQLTHVEKRKEKKKSRDKSSI